MKLLNRSLARALWFFPTEDLNPNGLDIVPVVAGVQSRYRFEMHPSKPEDISPAPNGIQFGKGTFRLSDGQQIEIVNFTIYNDGLVADTKHSTQATEDFLEDVLSFVTANFRLTFKPEMIHTKAYLSDVVVTTDADLDNVSEKLQRFAALLSDASGRIQFRTASVKLVPDPLNPGIPTQFTFERRGGTPFGQKRYFSEAPLRSERHMEILEAWENIMAS
jgi:hypothetical protein